MIVLRFLQLTAGIAVVGLLAITLVFRDSIGFKGMPVPASDITLCFIASAVAAYITTRSWHWLPAPFMAGIVGAFFGGRLGPMGGVLGFLVGLAVTVAVVVESRVTRAEEG